MNKIFEKPVAILGGGATAQTFAADFALAGHKVHLYESPQFAEKSLGKVLKTHEIELEGKQINFKGFRRTGKAKIDVVTTKASEALGGTGLIVVSVPSIAHKPFFEKMIPYLEDEQIISIFPDNFGSLILKRMMEEKNSEAKVIVGGWSSQPYGTRVTEPGKLDCIMRIRTLLGDALPSKDRDKFFEALKEIPAFDGTTNLEKGDTVIGVGLSNPNPAVHTPGSILNVGAMEVSEEEGILGIPKGGYSMYKYGMCPSVARTQLAFYHEEKEIANALGIKMVEYTDEQFFWKGSVMGIEYLAPFIDVVMPPIKGPLSVKDRYFTEDIPVGCNVRYQLAKKLKVEVPVIESIIRLGSVICEKDFFKEGRSLREIGLEDLNKDQILQYVREGVRSRHPSGS
ncbi:MAG TPA: NAD/NADP octopine/nopaline dehydrogenase [Thermoplasmata archaeon]|nr:NAD/NADP octopine/nopaline dehydrogenase [Thermoplasmata archaeon]